MKPLSHILAKKIDSVASAFFRLVLIVGQHGSRKSALLLHYAEERHHEIINIGSELSKQLMEEPSRNRPARVASTFQDIANTDTTLVLLDNIEILFDPTLKVNLLKLL